MVRGLRILLVFVLSHFLVGFSATSTQYDRFSVSANYSYDKNNNATVTLKYCNQTDLGAGCTPANAVAMTRGVGVFDATVTSASFPAGYNPGDVIKYSVEAVDADGASGTPGNPLTGIVTLAAQVLAITPDPRTGMDITGGSSPGATVNFTVTNIGNSISNTLGLAVLGGTNPLNFEIVSDGCVGVMLAASGGTCTVSVRPVAVANGSYSATLSTGDGIVTSNAAALSGTASGFAVTPNDITVSALATSGVTNDDFNAQINFSGDGNSNAVVTLYWCNASDFAGCNPEVANGLSQGSVLMVRGLATYTASVTNIAYPTEGAETLNVRVIATDADGVTGSPLNTTVALLPVLDIGELAVVEGGAIQFTATLNRASASNVVFNWATSDGTATSGSDYTAASGLATIVAGQTFVNLTAISTTDDAVQESTETFNVTLSSTSNAIVRTATALGRIADNDPGLAWMKGPNGTVKGLAQQTDGKRILVGDFTGWDDTLDIGAVRTQSNGSQDLSFYTGTGFISTPATPPNSVALVYSWVRQPDGKWIVAGDFEVYNGVAASQIVRLNSDGSIDSSFTSAMGADQYIGKVVVLPNNKIVIVGNFSSYGGVARNKIARLNSDGSLDTTFNPVLSALVRQS